MTTPAVAQLRPKSLSITCDSCPWQAEGRLDDGRFFYMRHRFCSAQLGIGETFDEAVRQTFDPACRITYHENNATDCPHNGYCSGLQGEEIAFVWHKLAETRADAGYA